ncbi:MAG: RdgB/HAM1 family non-canonical purine NTP pyrophosphatase [Rikenellaceae bacterium]
MKSIIFATANAHKLEEIQAILGDKFKITTPAKWGITEEIPENEMTLEGNARQKVHYIFDRTRKNCFADDTGLEVVALGGAPGVHSARYAGAAKNNEDNIDLLLSRLGNMHDRRARFRTVICLIYESTEFVFEGIVEGQILSERQGEGGFGYDAIFMPDGYDRSFAQMSIEEKNEISHQA